MCRRVEIGVITCFRLWIGEGGLEFYVDGGIRCSLKMGYEYYGDGYEYYGDCLRVALNKCLIDSEISERSVRLMITVSIGKRG